MSARDLGDPLATRPGAATDPRRRILVIAADPGEAARIAAALAPLGVEIERGAAVDALSLSCARDLVVVDYDDLIAAEGRVEALEALRRRAPLLVRSAGGCREDFVALFERRALTNLIARNGEAGADDLVVTARKMLGGEVFGLEQYFSPDARAFATTAVRSSDKERLLREVEAFLEGAGVRARLVELVCSVADELVTNALYNAPVDASGRRRYAHLSRASEVVLGEGERLEVRLCRDGRRVGIAAIDPFGSITAERVLDCLAKCIRKGADQVNRRAGGAGIGLYYAFETLSHLIVNISAGRRTEVIGLLDIRGSYKNFASGTKSFNLFSGQWPAGGG